ncbi:MAG TPA: hypothetical protein VGV91_13390, partial [Rubrobacter sp.]|nr:hypothetical protein [Rubrobacter sp.]
VRLRAPDGYTAQRSYSVASAPEDERLVLTVDRLDDGEVFSFGVTTAEYTCRGRSRVGAATDHEARGLGMVVRCPRLRQRPDPARHRPRAALDRPDEGMRYVQVGNGDG